MALLRLLVVGFVSLSSAESTSTLLRSRVLKADDLGEDKGVGSLSAPAPAPPRPKTKKEGKDASKDAKDGKGAPTAKEGDPVVDRKAAMKLLEGYLEQYPWDQLAPTLTKDDVNVGSDEAACGPSFSELCKSVTPGLGRAASCLRQKMSGSKNEVDQSKLGGSKSCKIEVNKFFSTARKDITKYNTQLSKACSSELSGICKNSATGAEGDFAAKKKTPFACLKDKKKKLSEECAAEVFQEQVVEAEDVRLDNGEKSTKLLIAAAVAACAAAACAAAAAAVWQTLNKGYRSTSFVCRTHD
jgi:hypothetical protein